MFSKMLSALVLSLMLISVQAIAGEPTISPIQTAVQLMMANKKLPANYSLAKVGRPALLGTGLGKRLSNLTRQKVKAWKELVLESGEYDYLKPEERELALKSPAKYLKVPYLIEIDEVVGIYLNGELIGYKFEAADHVQGAIFQDGAGIDFDTDKELNVVGEESWAA